MSSGCNETTHHWGVVIGRQSSAIRVLNQKNTTARIVSPKISAHVQFFQIFRAAPRVPADSHKFSSTGAHFLFGKFVSNDTFSDANTCEDRTIRSFGAIRMTRDSRGSPLREGD